MINQQHKAIRIFVSHTSADNEFGYKLVKGLRNRLGDSDAVWYDSQGGLRGGDAWQDIIVSELTRRNVFIVILSNEANRSVWVKREIRMALRRKRGLKIIPIVYRKCRVRPELEDFQVISFVFPKDFNAAFQELLFALNLQINLDRKITTEMPPISSIFPAQNTSVLDTHESKVTNILEPVTTSFIPETNTLEQTVIEAFKQKAWRYIIEKVKTLAHQQPNNMSSNLYRMQGIAYLYEGDKFNAKDAIETAITLAKDNEQRIALVREYTQLFPSVEAEVTDSLFENDIFEEELIPNTDIPQTTTSLPRLNSKHDNSYEWIREIEKIPRNPVSLVAFTIDIIGLPFGLHQWLYSLGVISTLSIWGIIICATAIFFLGVKARIEDSNILATVLSFLLSVMWGIAGYHLLDNVSKDSELVSFVPCLVLFFISLFWHLHLFRQSR